MNAIYKSKKSAWGAISIWKILLFGIILPAALVLGSCIFKTQSDAYLASSSSSESSSVIEEISSIEEDGVITESASVEESAPVEESASVEDSASAEAGAGVVENSSSGESAPTESSETLIQKLAPFAGITFIACCAIAAISFLITLVAMIVAIYRAKQVSFEFYENTVVIHDGLVFSGSAENRTIFFYPGMNISVKQSFKGKFFNYGDVVVSLGIGAVGQIVMEGIKKPNKAKKILMAYAAEIGSARADKLMLPYMYGIPGMMGYPFKF